MISVPVSGLSAFGAITVALPVVQILLRGFLRFWPSGRIWRRKSFSGPCRLLLLALSKWINQCSSEGSLRLRPHRMHRLRLCSNRASQLLHLLCTEIVAAPTHKFCRCVFKPAEHSHLSPYHYIVIDHGSELLVPTNRRCALPALESRRRLHSAGSALGQHRFQLYFKVSVA